MAGMTRWDVIKQEVPERLPNFYDTLFPTLYLRVVNKSTCATVLSLIESIKKKKKRKNLFHPKRMSPHLIPNKHNNLSFPSP